MAFNTSSRSSEPITAGNPMQYQLSHLCVLQAAATASCKTRNDIKYASSESNTDKSLSDFQRLLCKLAQALHTEKGAPTNTALVCLAAPGGGAEFIFASNFRKSGQLEEAKRFLEGLLQFAVNNPDRLNARPLQKQVLWRLMEFSFKRVDSYLKKLSHTLLECIEDCADASVTKQLENFREKVDFPREMVDAARNKILCDCESFIKAIEASKNTPLGAEIDLRTRQDDPDTSFKWCELRHCLGRLYSYHQAAEIIVGATTQWPELFRSYKISYIASAKQKKIPLPTSSDLTDVISGAFPEHNIEEFRSDIIELQNYNLNSEIRDQIRERSTKTFVHAEVHLHHYLTEERKVQPSDFWEGIMFIATSKPPCRLCYYYFQNDDNDFNVQSPHMNLYPKWRLPDDATEDVLEDIIEKMQASTLSLFKEKLPDWRRNDSRTDSHTGIGQSTRQEMRPDSTSTDHPSGMGMSRPYSGMAAGGYHNVPPPHPDILEDTIPLEYSMEDYGIIGDRGHSARNGGSGIGIAQSSWN